MDYKYKMKKQKATRRCSVVVVVVWNRGYAHAHTFLLYIDFFSLYYVFLFTLINSLLFFSSRLWACAQLFIVFFYRFGCAYWITTPPPPLYFFLITFKDSFIVLYCWFGEFHQPLFFFILFVCGSVLWFCRAHALVYLFDVIHFTTVAPVHLICARVRFIERIKQNDNKYLYEYYEYGAVSRIIIGYFIRY